MAAPTQGRPSTAPFRARLCFDWDREQETLYVLVNKSLSKQIAEWLKTLKANSGYTPSKQELDEIHSV